MTTSTQRIYGTSEEGPVNPTVNAASTTSRESSGDTTGVLESIEALGQIVLNSLQASEMQNKLILSLFTRLEALENATNATVGKSIGQAGTYPSGAHH